MGGGTALAMQIAHRESYDFDFFSQRPIPKNHLEKISKTLGIKNISVDTAEELTFFTNNSIKITFLHYPFPRHFPPIKIEHGLSIFEVKEISLHKAYTIGRRGEYRDYFDLYSILKNEYIKFNTLIPLAKKMYGNIFDEKLFLQQLIYFNDLTNFDIIPISRKSKTPTPKEIQNFFESLIKDYI
jgi:predicted nucleotidyltransferase component of viral defense system